MKKSIQKLVTTVTTMCLTVGLLGAGYCLPNEKTASAASGVEINKTNFADENLLLIAQDCDNRGNQDGKLDAAETKNAAPLYISDLTNLKKYLQYFPYVTSLTLSVGNTKSITINKNITTLNMVNSTTTKPVDIIGGSKLKSVYFSTAKKASLNFNKAKGYSNLKSLSVNGTKVNSITIPNQKKIQVLTVNGTAISKLDISKCKKLTSFSCYNTKIKSLNISANKNLKDIGAGYSKLAKLNTSKNKKLESIVVNDTKIKSVDVKKNKKLNHLDVSNNKLTKIDTSKNTKLNYLDVSNNKLTKIDVTKNKKLTSLHFNNNKISKIKIKKNNKITSLTIGNNKSKSFSLSDYKKLTYLSVGDDYALLKNIGFTENLYLSIDVSKKKAHNLKNYLPKMKNCSFANSWDNNNEYYTISSNGTLKFTNKAKNYKYVSFAFLNIVNGTKKMSLTVRY